MTTTPRHLSTIVQLPTFMDYINPARSSATNFELATVGQGYLSFKGLVNARARVPVKMISYGIVSRSDLAQAREVYPGGKNALLVKSINIFPLPGEWERTVGFIGTCVNTAQLLFSPFQGALSYSTRMVPAASMWSHALFVPKLTPSLWATGSRAHARVTPRLSSRATTPLSSAGSDPAGLPLPSDESTFIQTSLS